jgi:hypothetical protein
MAKPMINPGLIFAFSAIQNVPLQKSPIQPPIAEGSILSWLSLWVIIIRLHISELGKSTLKRAEVPAHRLASRRTGS